MAPCTPPKYNCSIAEVKAKDEASASRLSLACGIILHDNRPELAAVIGGREVWASVERPPHVGQRRRAPCQEME